MITGNKGGEGSRKDRVFAPRGMERPGVFRAVWPVWVLLALTLTMALPLGATAAGDITEFAVPTAKCQPYGIVLGPDGNLWFTEEIGNKIGRITPAGVITEFPIPTANSKSTAIASGPDGNLWFTGYTIIGRITPSGVITEFALPVGSVAVSIASGPDGALWFAERDSNKIGRITPAGAITEFLIPTPASSPVGIALGPDGNLWFTELNGNNIGQITPAGVVTEFPIPTLESHPLGIVSGPDGALWFTQYGGNKIGRITIEGVITEFPVPTVLSTPVGIAAGPYGGLWFTEENGNNIGRITTTGVITEFPLPAANSYPAGIASGPDGNLWFTEKGGNKIGAISGCLTITLAPATLPGGLVGTSYSQAITSGGGTGPYTYEITEGSAPAGITLSSGGLLAGTPMAEGTSSFTVTSTDVFGCEGIQAYSLAIVCRAITLSPSVLPDCAAGSAYSHTITATGGTGPYTYGVTSGSIPTGLDLSSGGVLSGTCIAGGTFTFTVSATDVDHCTGSREYAVTVTCPVITPAPASLLVGTVGSAYSQALTASGGAAPYTFAVTVGTLPAGLSLSSGGLLTGTPTAEGITNFTVTATDIHGCTGSKGYSLTIVCTTLTFAPPTLPDGTVGTPYSQTIAASGGTEPTTYSVIGGALPTGLSLTPTGVVAGNPTAGGTFDFTVKATDANACAGSQAYSITMVCPAITLSPSTFPGGTIGVPYSLTITASGGTEPHTYSVVSGTLPTGLNLTSGGLLAGNPTAGGTFDFTVEATDANGCTGSGAYSITMVCPTITLSPSTLPDGAVGTSYGQAIAASGSAEPYYTFTMTGGTLPAGLTLTSSGLLYGTPTAAGAFSFTVTATDANNCTGSRAYSVTMTCPAILFAPSSLPGATMGVSYSQTITASGGTAPFTYETTNGSLPGGLVLSSAGVLSGTPVAKGTFSFTVTATDVNNCAGSHAYSVTIICPTILFSPSSLPGGAMGVSYSQTIAANGGTAPYTYSVISGALPAGLSLTSEGLLAGKPTAVGTFDFSVKATDAYECTESKEYSIGVVTGIPGDCDGDGHVSIGEVQKAINMFLGLLPVGCGVDCDGSGSVSIGEVQKVINAFLGLTSSC